MVRRHELTDEQWQAIKPFLPPSGTKGRPRADDRRVINGMLFKAKTGLAWRDLPERYGPWKTIYTRFWRWSRDGTLTMLVTKARVIAEAIDELDREVSVDSSIVRAHQHAAGARKAGKAGKAGKAQVIERASGGDNVATTASHTGGGRVLQRTRRTS